MRPQRFIFSLLLSLSLAACGKSPSSYTRGVPDESLAHTPHALAGAIITPPSSGTSNGTGLAVPAASAR
jgi:hypothetical protein